MTISEPSEAYVWVWLPDADEPIVAGRLDLEGPMISFTYGQSYLGTPGAVPLYLPELPLRRGRIDPLVGDIAGCIADAGPDAWGQRVVLNRKLGRGGNDTADLNALTYLLESGSDRIGALDFQDSPRSYTARTTDATTLDELAESVERVERGIPLSPALDQALLHGSSIGGARPKALIRDGNRRLIAKFSSSTDTYPIVKAEFVAMRLAQLCGLGVANVELAEAMGRDVLLVERFDRPGGGRRLMTVSALTVLGLSEIEGRYASYADLADQIRHRFREPTSSLQELFARITFNILTGNSDDHARNHSAFWDGEALTLTPAYDVCPQPRSGGETSQAMAIGREGYRMAQLSGCVEHAAVYLQRESDARELIDHQISTIERHWQDVCDEAGLSEAARAGFWRRQFLNPYALEDYGATV